MGGWADGWMGGWMSGWVGLLVSGWTGGRWKIPGLQRVEEEYIMTRSMFEPFEMKAKVPGGGEGKVNYLVGGVEYGDLEAAVKVFGRAV